MDYINAFWVGGLICALTQILLDRTKLMPGRIMVLFGVQRLCIRSTEDISGYSGFCRSRSQCTVTGVWKSSVERCKRSRRKRRIHWDIYGRI